MKKVLVVVDMQNDFIDGALGTKEAVSIVANVVSKIRSFDGQILATLDTHGPDYLQTAEGRSLPVPHCIRGQKGWQLEGRVQRALEAKGYQAFEKGTFGSVALMEEIGRILKREEAAAKDDCVQAPVAIEMVGLCTDICVVSNALLFKAHYPQLPIAVDAACCAGVTPKTHQAALETMKMCQIAVENG